MPFLRLRDVVPFRDIPVAEVPKAAAAALADVLPWQYPEATNIGMEIEVEELTEDVREPRLYYWEKIHDGSLRGIAAEYRSAGVVAPGQIPKAIAELHRMLDKVHPRHKFSPRTSIHVHMDMRDATLNTLACFVLTYRLFEKFLYSFTDAERMQSNFCHPSFALDWPNMHDWFQAVARLTSRSSARTQQGHFAAFVRRIGRNKYTAFNISNLMSALRMDDEHAGTGTIEFRHLAGTGDAATIMQWTGALQCLYNFAQNSDLLDLLNIIDELNTNSEYLKLARRVFPHPALFVRFQMQPQKVISDAVATCKAFYQPVMEVPSISELVNSPLAQTTLQLMYAQPPNLRGPGAGLARGARAGEIRINMPVDPQALAFGVNQDNDDDDDDGNRDEEFGLPEDDEDPENN